MHIWNQLSGNNQHEEANNHMIGNVKHSRVCKNSAKDVYERHRRLYVPLPFWFCKHIGNITFNCLTICEGKKYILLHKQHAY